MVNMVKHLLAFVMTIAVVTASALAAPAVHLDRKRIALGESVTLILTTKPGTLEKLDLGPLSRSFEILNRNLGRDKSTETLTLTLYPLRTGRLDLALPGIPGRAPTLEVTDGSDDTPRVRYRVDTEPAAYHARQPLRLTLEACDAAGMQWTRPPLPTREGLFLRALGEEQQQVERDGERCTAQRWHWAVTPTAAGATTLPLPMLEANKLGRRLRFPPPVVALEAQAIPEWLPAEAAIGKPTVAAAALPTDWPIERPLAWRIEVTGGYSADALKTLLALQLAAQPLLTAYPPTVAAMPTEHATPRHAITLTLLPRSRGTATLPELAFPWYDPATGRVEQVRLPGPALKIIDPVHQRLMLALALFAALAATLLLGWLAYRTLGWRWRRRIASADFARATDIADLSRRLRAFSLHGAVPPAPTLGAWRVRMESEARAPGLAALVTALEQAGYSDAPADLPALKRQAAGVLAALSAASARSKLNERMPASIWR